MRKPKRELSAAFKAKVALEALQEKKTITQIAAEYEVHANQVCFWKKQLLSNSEKVFSGPASVKEDPDEKLQDDLYKQIGKLQVQNDWLKKKSAQFLGLKFAENDGR